MTIALTLLGAWSLISATGLAILIQRGRARGFRDWPGIFSKTAPENRP